MRNLVIDKHATIEIDRFNQFDRHAKRGFVQTLFCEITRDTSVIDIEKYIGFERRRQRRQFLTSTGKGHKQKEKIVQQLNGRSVLNVRMMRRSQLTDQLEGIGTDLNGPKTSNQDD